MNFNTERLYKLLPAIFQIRDAEIGARIQGILDQSNDENFYGPLKALIEIIAQEVEFIEENLDQIYDDMFIETCAEWVIPYIGELIGYRQLNTSAIQRAEVANTISYRRGKGTESILEQLAKDITGWDVNVVEYFQVLATTQYLNHLRLHNKVYPNLRDWKLLEYANTPFDTIPRTIDVRRIEPKLGNYNIKNIGIFLWRIPAYSSTKSIAFKIDEQRFTFDPIGRDIGLYNLPVAEQNITQLAEPINVPMPISRRVLYEDVTSAIIDDDELISMLYGEDKSLFLYINGIPLNPQNAYSIFSTFASPPTSPPQPIELKDIICISDLSNNVGGWNNMPTDRIAIDPKLGRIALPPLLSPPDENIIEVNYHYGFSADIGGGEYNREDTFTTDEEDTIKIEISKNTIGIQEAIHQILTTLNQSNQTIGIVEMIDNHTYWEDIDISIPPGKTIEIRAKDGVRPVLILQKPIGVKGGEKSTLILNGLMIHQYGLEVDSNAKLSELRIVHCTFTPSNNTPSLVINSPNTKTDIDKSIVSSLQIHIDSETIIKNTILDILDKDAIGYSSNGSETEGGKLTIENATIIGKIFTQKIEASNSIFLSSISVKRIQEGCIRFSYFPESIVPRSFRCQAQEGQLHIKPSFTSLVFSDAGYCQLSEFCPSEITQGADDESEMGVFHNLFQAQKTKNLRIRLNEYLPFGLEAGIFYAS